MWHAVSVDARLDVNVAKGRPSYQVSTYTDADGTYPPSYANDGGHGTDMNSGPCAVTYSDKPVVGGRPGNATVRAQRQIHQQEQLTYVYLPCQFITKFLS